MKIPENYTDQELLNIFEKANSKLKTGEDLTILEGLFTRRSIRSFTGEIVDDKSLLTILKAASYAPSAKNKQPWHFIVVKNKDMLEKLSEIHPYVKMIPKSGCAIVVCGDINEEKEKGFVVEDCSAAIQNILLAAHSLKLGTVWCGIYPISKYVKTVRTLFNLTTDIVPIGIVAIGHTHAEKDIPNRFNPKKIHYEKW